LPEALFQEALALAGDIDSACRVSGPARPQADLLLDVLDLGLRVEELRMPAAIDLRQVGDAPLSSISCATRL
jgi:hypothetical protein